MASSLGSGYKCKETTIKYENGAYPWMGANKNYGLYNVDELGAFVTIKQPF